MIKWHITRNQTEKLLITCHLLSRRLLGHIGNICLPALRWIHHKEKKKKKNLVNTSKFDLELWSNINPTLPLELHCLSFTFLWHRMSTLPFRVRACLYLFIYVLIYEHFCLFIHLFTFPRFVGTVMLTAAKMRRTLPLGEMCSKLFWLSVSLWGLKRFFVTTLRSGCERPR